MMTVIQTGRVVIEFMLMFHQALLISFTQILQKVIVESYSKISRSNVRKVIKSICESGIEATHMKQTEKQIIGSLKSKK